MLRHIVRAAAAWLLVLLVPTHGQAAPTRPIPQVSRVLLVSVDGLRPDLLLRADAPVIRSLMKRGSYSMWARTTAVAVTLPTHVSMLTGVSPGRHGIEWNQALPLERQIYPAYPTLFELARQAGYTTAMAAGKSKFRTLEEPGSLTRSFVPDSSVISDAAVADTALAWIRGFGPQVLFVHLPQVDSVGHASGWGSAEQLRAIAGADRIIGRLLDSMKTRGVLDSTFVLITSDHGGAGKSHGPDDPRSRTIPWIAAGPGVRRDFDLTTQEEVSIQTEDTFATLCYVLGIKPPRAIEGHVVTKIFIHP